MNFAKQSSHGEIIVIQKQLKQPEGYCITGLMKTIFMLSSPEVQEQLIKLFVDAFKDMTFIQREPEKGDFIKLSDTRPFVWSKLVYPANRCIFNYVPCDNDFEVDFAKFLDGAEDVEAFSKIVSQIGFFVEYKDSKDNFRLYYPDFVVTIDESERLIIETKGREDVDVEHKDKRIILSYFTPSDYSISH